MHIVEYHRCPSCQSTAKESDTQCWVCGYDFETKPLVIPAPLPIYAPPKPIVALLQAPQQSDTDDAQDPPSQALVVFQSDEPKVAPKRHIPQRAEVYRGKREKTYSMRTNPPPPRPRKILKRRQRAMIGVVASLMVGSVVGTQVLARTQGNAANEITPFVPTIFSVETPTPTNAPQPTSTTVMNAQPAAVVVLPSPTPSPTVQTMPTQVALPTKAAPTPSATIVVSKPTLKVLHVAKAGETCDAIAKRYNVSPETLAQLNEFASVECKLSVDQLVVVANAPLDALPKTRIAKPTRAPMQPPTATQAPITTIAPELPTPQPATQLQPAPPVSPPTVQPQPTVCDAKNFASPCFLP